MEKNELFTDVLNAVVESPFLSLETHYEIFSNVENFVTEFYQGGTTLCDVNQVRKLLFCHRTQELRKLPSYRDALFQYLKRSIYQGGILPTAHLATLPSSANFR